jgi:hypothetical protein
MHLRLFRSWASSKCTDLCLNFCSPNYSAGTFVVVFSQNLMQQLLFYLVQFSLIFFTFKKKVHNIVEISYAYSLAKSIFLRKNKNDNFPFNANYYDINMPRHVSTSTFKTPQYVLIGLLMPLSHCVPFFFEKKTVQITACLGPGALEYSFECGDWRIGDFFSSGLLIYGEAILLCNDRRWDKYKKLRYVLCDLSS